MYFLDTDTLTLAHADHSRVSDQVRRVDTNQAEKIMDIVPSRG